MDYNAIAKQYGAIKSVAPSGQKIDYSALAKQYGAIGTTQTTTPQTTTGGGFWQGAGNLAKGILTAPATMIARPVQLGAELMGASAEDVNKYNLGGLIAPVPQNAADVKKDVGRAIETVALGTTPIAGGAMFGAGSSLEQGNDLFSAQTALQTVMGAAAAPLLVWVGKPLLNATGKVIGTITPDTLKGLAAKGAGAVTDFMNNNQLINGVVKPIKPLASAITKVTTAVDTGVNKAIGTTLAGTKNLFLKEYGGSLKNIQEHYKKVNMENLRSPILHKNLKSGTGKALDIYNEAKAQGTNLDEILDKRGVIYEDLVPGKTFETTSIADDLRRNNSKDAEDMLAPMLEQADYSTPKIPLEDIRKEAIASVMKDMNISDKEAEILKINKRFGSTGQGSLRERYPDGMKISEINKEKVSHTLGTNFVNPDRNANYHISNGLRTILEAKAPTVIDPATGVKYSIKDFNKELQKIYQAADYLEALNGKRAIQSAFNKFVGYAGKFAGAGLGNKFVSGYGGFLGYHLGGFAIEAFEGMSNPVKMFFLRNAEISRPQVFQAFKAYLQETNQQNLLRKLLPAPTTIFKGPTQNGQPYTPNQNPSNPPPLFRGIQK